MYEFKLLYGSFSVNGFYFPIGQIAENRGSQNFSALIDSTPIDVRESRNDQLFFGLPRW